MLGNEENILGKTTIIKLKYKIPLVIIAVLVIILVILGLYLFLKPENPRNLYLNIMDNLVEEVNANLDEAVKGSEIYSVDSEINFNIKYDDEQIQEVLDILNKIVIKSNSSIDSKAKVQNNNIEILYNNKDLVNVELKVKDEDIYASLGSLYDKNIKLTDDEIKYIWPTSSIENTKVVISEVVSIIKKNLSDDYFSVDDAKIEINGKSVQTYKYVMDIKSDELAKFVDSILGDIKSNEKLITSLVEISGVSREDLLEVIDTYMGIYDYEQIYIEIYINKYTKELEKVVANFVMYNPSFMNCDSLDCDGMTTDKIVGTMLISDNNFEAIFNYNNEKSKLSGKITDNELNITLSMVDNLAEFDCKYGNDKINCYMKTTSTTEGLEAIINYSSELKEIDKVTNKAINDYAELNTVIESDYNKILENAAKNENIVSLIEEVMALDIVQMLLIYTQNSY